MKKYLVFFVLLIALVVVLSGCGAEGPLTSKQVDICTAQRRIETQPGVSIMFVESYTCYKFIVLSNVGSNEDPLYVTFEVSESTYNSYEVGDYYP